MNKDGITIYNSRNSKDLIVWIILHMTPKIYNSRNSKDLIVADGAESATGVIYNSRNSKDLIVSFRSFLSRDKSTTVEIQKT